MDPRLITVGQHYHELHAFYYMANGRSNMKRKILIGSPRGPIFVIRTAKIDGSRISLGELLFQNITVFTRAFTVNGSRGLINLSAEF